MRPLIISKIFITCFLFAAITTKAQTSDSIVLKDLVWDKAAPAGITELAIHVQPAPCLSCVR